MKKIGIVGSRRRCSAEDLARVKEEFLFLFQPGDWIVSGGCPKGADAFAELIAKERGVPILIFYPDWKQLGRTAGFARNTLIAKESDVLIACVAADRTGGTEDTIKKFDKAKPLHLV